MAAIRKILIVGGGTSGWLAAGYLARTLNAAASDGVKITLVESSDIGILGVGEGTFPTIRSTLATIGIDEARFLRESTATFKQGIKFVDWVRPPDGQGPRHYFHPFNLPSNRDGLQLPPYWLLGAAEPGQSFADAVTMQTRLVEASRGPKRLTDRDYEGPMNYAYHFDAAKFAKVLSEQAKALGVTHIDATVERVELDDTGAIAAVVTKEAGALSADLYIDCSGFKGLLMEALGAKFRDMNDVLFIDRAVAIQVPYERPDSPIPSYTISTAHECGWTWDIGLNARRGVGYVYSSRYTDDTRAEEVLRSYIGKAAEGLNARQLKLKVGYRERQWVKNCVAVGLSSGFVEPLESTGIGLIEMATYLIAHLFPHDGQMESVAKLFNEQMVARYERIIDFIKMHYCLTQRTDNRFWIDNADPATIPDSLKDKLGRWRCRPPHRLDFVADLEMFLVSSWQYILYGMEFKTDLSAVSGSYPKFEQAKREFQMIRQVSGAALNDLPSHRSLIDHVYQHGFRRAAG